MIHCDIEDGADRRERRTCRREIEGRSLVEIVFSLVLLDVVLVALLKVLGEDDVSVLADRLHAGFLADGVDIGAGNLVRTGDKVLQVHFLRQIHLRRDGGEDETLLTTIRQRELDFPAEGKTKVFGGEVD